MLLRWSFTQPQHVNRVGDSQTNPFMDYNSVSLFQKDDGEAKVRVKCEQPSTYGRRDVRVVFHTHNCLNSSLIVADGPWTH